MACGGLRQWRVLWLLLALTAAARCHLQLDRCVLRQSDLAHQMAQCGCPDKFISCAGRCYQRLNTAADHSAARDLCRRLHPSAHLAVPRSLHETLCVAGLAGGQPIWLGITDTETEGLFVGDDGGGVADVPTTGHRWSAGQPDNAGGREHCVEMWLAHAFADWNDRPCDYAKNMPMCQLGQL